MGKVSDSLLVLRDVVEAERAERVSQRSSADEGGLDGISSSTRDGSGS